MLTKKTTFLHIASFCGYFFASSYLTFPLIIHLGDRATGHGDELVIAWIQNWVVHAIESGKLLSLFDINAFFPYHNALAFSDLHLTSSIFALPVLKFMQEPIVTVNVTIISSLVLLGFSLYLLSYYLTRDFFASFLSGLLVIFSPAVLDKVTHIQILWIYWVPLAILCFLLFLNTQQTRYLVLSLLFFLVQTYNSFMPGYFIFFSYVVMMSFYWFSGKIKKKQLVNKLRVGIVLFSLLLVLPIVLPYYAVSQEFNYTRDIRDAIHFALQPEDLFYSSPHSRIQPLLNTLPFNQSSQNDEFKPGYLGIVFTLLVICTFGYLLKNKKTIERNVLLFGTIATIGLMLSFGPVVHLGRQTIHAPFPLPLPYSLFYYLVPGFQGFRNSARWEMLFILAIAIVIALVMTKVLQHVSLWKRAVLYAVLCIGIVSEFNFPMQLVSVPQRVAFPPVYKWIATTPSDTAIIELPIYNWNMWPYTQAELYREYYSTNHFRKTVNGYSGFSPPPWQEFITNTFEHFPSQSSISQLRKMGVDYVIIHRDEYDQLSASSYTIKTKKVPSGERIISEMKKYPEVKLIKTFANTFVYEL